MEGFGKQLAILAISFGIYFFVSMNEVALWQVHL